MRLSSNEVFLRMDKNNLQKPRLSSLNGLRHFEAAARMGSFSLAAEELFLTPAAVSYQIRLLEQELGITLFKRLPRMVVLTEAGAKFMVHVQAALATIQEGIREVAETQRTGPLNVSLVPSFAQQWLLPRLERFNKLYPDIQLRINATSRVCDFNEDGYHMAVRLGNGNWGSGLIEERFFEERVFPVCCPDLAAKYPIKEPLDLLKMPLLHNDFYPWKSWFEAVGESVEVVPKGPMFDDANLLLVAALQGMGVSLIRTTVAEGNLAQARLIRPFDMEVVADRAYYLVTPKRFKDHAGVIAFREWILDETAQSLETTCPTISTSKLGST